MWLSLWVQRIGLSALVASLPWLLIVKTLPFSRGTEMMRFIAIAVEPMKAVANSVEEEGNLKKDGQGDSFAPVVAGPSVAPHVWMRHATLQNASC